MPSQDYHIAIAGASGAVGQEMLRVLERREFPVGKLTLLASARSAGRTLRFRGEELPIQELKEDSFSGVDFAFFSAGSGVSRELAPMAARAGAVVIDNSSAFRADEAVPLVVPEINAADLASHRGIIANPNCTTAIALMGLYPLHKAFGLRRVIASSYQAVSGAGARAIAELEEQTETIARGEEEMRAEIFPHQIAFNVLPQVDSFLENGYTKEEMKMQNEGRRILHLRALRASVTCVRVPVYRAHSVAITAEFRKPVALDEARLAIQEAQGVQLLDNPARNEYPMPIHCAGEDDCYVGRLRHDNALENALSLWVCGDQLLKGAALNAVQIAECLLKNPAEKVEASLAA